MAFQFASVNQVTFEWDEETTSESLTLDKAIFEMDNFLQRLERDTKAERSIMCLSSSPNFRHSVLPTYKHNRADAERPKLLEELKEYLRTTYEFREKPNLEADDVMGILATRTPGRYIIATIDKDLQQIPGRHYNWRNGELFDVTEEEGNYYFYMQILTGDPTDGYKGCPGIGPKKAERILEDVPQGEDPWSAIVTAYESKGLTEEDALQQARVARILRASDYDFKQNRPKLWSPAA